MNSYQNQAFMHWYGTVVLRREKDAGGSVSINDDYELLKEAFQEGWAWAEEWAKGLGEKAGRGA